MGVTAARRFRRNQLVLLTDGLMGPTRSLGRGR
jgi:hypothetical protein